MPRVLSEDEFNALRDSVIAQAPQGLDEKNFNLWFQPRMEAALGRAENSAAPVTGSAVWRFVSNAADVLNPIAAVEGLASAVAHPIDTMTAIGRQSLDQLAQARDQASQGHYSEAIGHLGGAVPLVGPQMVQAGQQIAAGDYAGGAGRAAGLIAPIAALDAATVAGKAAGVIPKSSSDIIADRLDKMAAARTADVMAPKVGANKARFGNLAEKVAPQINDVLAQDGAPLTREGLHQQVQAKLGEAEQALDAAADARNPNAVVYTSPIVKALQAKAAAMTAQTVKAGGMKAGEDVVPTPNLARVNTINGAIDEIKQLGPVANYDALRRIRQSYDGPAKAVYSPAVTADYLKAQGSKLGAADVTGVLRDKLAQMDPATAAANAQYSLFKTADDVLNATKETERTRPKVGRQIMARLTATLAGEHAAGVPGAAVGYALGPVLDSAISSGITTKLQTARVMTQLADAIRRGDYGMVNSLSYRLKQLTAGSLVDKASTSPSESQTRSTAPVSLTP